jgi:hypothetical protein
MIEKLKDYLLKIFTSKLSFVEASILAKKALRASDEMCCSLSRFFKSEN